MAFSPMSSWAVPCTFNHNLVRGTFLSALHLPSTQPGALHLLSPFLGQLCYNSQRDFSSWRYGNMAKGQDKGKKKKTNQPKLTSKEKKKRKKDKQAN
jgi:hypothetical protein